MHSPGDSWLQSESSSQGADLGHHSDDAWLSAAGVPLASGVDAALHACHVSSDRR